MVILVAVNAPENMSDLGELAPPLLEDWISPAVVFQVRKTIDKGLSGGCAVDWNEQIDAEDTYEPVGEPGIVDRNDGVKPATPKAGAPRRSGGKACISRSGITQPIRTGRYSSQIRGASDILRIQRRGEMPAAPWQD